MTRRIILLAILLLALIVGAGFLFKDGIVNVSKKLNDFEKIDLGTIINEIKEEVFAPNPLNVGGPENEAVLIKAKIIAQTNIQRYNNGLMPPLIENEKLYLAAKAKADDMFEKQYFEHVSPSGVGPGSLVKSYDYQYVVSGENLILGNFKDEAEVVQRWMDSPGHRANILNSRFSEIGVAIVKGIYKDQIAWIGVQEFGLPISACQIPNDDLRNQINSNGSELEQLSSKINVKKQEIDNTNPRSSEYNQRVDKHNVLVAEYNALNQAIKNLIVNYNAQVNMFNQCVSGK